LAAPSPQQKINRRVCVHLLHSNSLRKTCCKNTMSSSPTVGSTNRQEPMSMKKEATRHIQDHPGKQQQQQQQQQQSSTLRTSIGRQLSSFSNFVNDNFIAARYGTFATITCLTAYGLSKTPLFVRFQTVADIPSSFFARRKTIYGRIVHVIEHDTQSAYYFS